MMKNVKTTLARAALPVAVAALFSGSALADGVQLLQLEPEAPRAAMQAQASGVMADLLSAPTTQAVRTAVLTQAGLDPQLGQIALPTPDGQTVEYRKFEADTTRDGVSIWRGEITTDRLSRYRSANEVQRDAANQAILVNHNGNLTGSFHKDGQLYQIWPIGNGRHAVAKVDPSHLELSDDGLVAPHDDAPQAPQPASAGSAAAADAGGQASAPAVQSAESTIRVMIVTTRQSRARVSDMKGLVNLAFTEANQGAENSRVKIHFQHAGTFDADYNETGNYSEMLSTMRAGNSSLGDQIHRFREAHRADLVVMLATEGGVGIGYVDANARNGVSVVNYSYATGYYTFAHEMGHNIGTSHDMAQYGGKPYGQPEYRHGYKHTAGSGANRWRTIMSYGCSPSCTRLNYFSNPDVTYNGVPMGTARYENNARRLNERREIVENFYPPMPGAQPVVAATASPDTVTGSASVRLDGSGSRVPDGGKLSFRWTQTGGAPMLPIAHDTAAVASVQIPAVDAKTSFKFKLEATNATGEKDSKTVTVTALPDQSAGGPPQAIVGGDRTVVETTNYGFAYPLDGGASKDPSGQGLTYRWRAVNGPFSVRYPDRAKAEAIVPKLSTGTSVFELTVTDRQGRSSKATTRVSAIAAQAKISGRHETQLGTPLELHGSVNFSGTSAKPVRYEWTVSDASGKPVLNASGEGWLTPAGLPAGKYMVRLRAHSEHGMRSATATHAFEIKGEQLGANCAPAWQARSYPGGNKVTHNGRSYTSKWWAEPHHVPGASGWQGEPWRDDGACR